MSYKKYTKVFNWLNEGKKLVMTFMMNKNVILIFLIWILSNSVNENMSFKSRGWKMGYILQVIFVFKTHIWFVEYIQNI